MPYLGAIADDFTGATDLATMLVARGFRTVVTVGPPGAASTADPGTGNPGGPEEEEPDAVVVALKSRTAPVADAVADSLAALHALRAAGCRRFYLKYCSTFDSTPEGNIGPVADALLDELGAPGTVVVPAFPATGRTVYRARLFVHDELLDESSMRDHPLTPMRDAHLGRLLAPQTRRPVHLIGHDTVRAGADAVRRALHEPSAREALSVVDAITDDDLRTIATATADLPLVTGAAGLALGLAGPHEGTASRARSAAGPGPGAILSGSASATTRDQVRHAREWLPHRKLDLAALRADPDAAVTALVAFARDAWRAGPDRPPLLYASDGAEDVAGALPDAAGLIESALARCAVELVAAGAHRLLVAGGETSGAVVTALGAGTLRVGAPIAPGVPWVHTEARLADGRSRPVDLALKSGNFGARSMFTTAWKELA
ncbi:3-oxo-tetronate kinase [Streptomyces sp. NEAU-YJ-81]|uniref:3-oxo-tetronate kinase n=1 Tax=Streptomyces sp. NEAU-YJ-81 TaxID=2820288 RepID=UPI001ABD2916|nr:3-oxo-tetronate kinase [Streptomyces sp. NEAU-YJ-81]MBO3677221.1 four-carbon acid sugar kinase family protein [Streptomyces sp. NEAU-YJ-81]